MKTLAIDIETFSSVDLKKSGVYKYVESPDFEIILFAYKLNDDPVQCIQLPGDDPDLDDIEIYNWIREMLIDPDILKTAYNANFERICIQKHFGLQMPIEQWECTAAKASYMGLPLGLEAVATALKMKVNKMTEGRALIKYFCCPCKPTKKNEGRTRNLPQHDPERWKAFIDYNKNDVLVEHEVRHRLHHFQFPEREKRVYWLDQKINDRGVQVDLQMVHQALQLHSEYQNKLYDEATAITELENPNSVAQLKSWILQETGYEMDSLSKAAVTEALDDGSADSRVQRVLQIRQLMSKSSVKKYTTMIAAACSDGRVRGMLQYYGANRTGRWAGRLVQLHNLPRNYMDHLDLARGMVKAGELDLLEITFGNVAYVLSQLVRTAFIPAAGQLLAVADFSAIEARVIAWLAGERWRLDVFATHGKIYEASAAAMFKKNIDDIKKGSTERDSAKIAELALGYQGSVGAMTQMIITEKTRAAENGKVWNYDPTEEQMLEVVRAWRKANPKICKLWETVEDAAFEAIQEETAVQVDHGIKFFVDRNILFCELPSGRRLAYLRPRIGVGDGGNLQITYEGMEQTRKVWIRQSTYGGKLVENIVQAIARDCLAESMMRLDAAGYDLVMHVHDEAVMEIEFATTDEMDVICQIMSQPIKWAKGLQLNADGFLTDYYKKD